MTGIPYVSVDPVDFDEEIIPDEPKYGTDDESETP